MTSFFVISAIVVLVYLGYCYNVAYRPFCLNERQICLPDSQDKFLFDQGLMDKSGKFLNPGTKPACLKCGCKQSLQKRKTLFSISRVTILCSNCQAIWYKYWLL